MEKQVVVNAAPEFEKILPAVMHIEQHCTEELDISNLAELCSMNDIEFKHAFVEYTGVTVIEYRNRIRIEKAYTLISGGHSTVANAAKSVGFDNIYYFSHLFKSIMGVSPRSLINNNKTDSE